MELSTLLLGILAICICMYYFILSQMSYFDQRKVPYQRPVPLLGNMAPYIFRRISFVDNIHRLYNHFSNARYFGFYDLMTPVYVIRDPELINTIAIKNFDNFTDHRNFVNDDVESIARRNLFGLRGDHWREMRKLLSPSFTSSKMKMMFVLMCQCAENFTDFVITESGKSSKTYDMKDTLRRYATDVVATCAFGISVDSFNQPKNEFFLVGKKTINFDFKMTLKFLMCRNWPRLAKLLKIRVFSAEIENFFKNIVTDTVKARDEHGIVRRDMMQLMMETRDKNYGPIFDIDEMTAQAFVFFVAGFDSVSTVMCFLAHEIAVNPDVQTKLRAEIEDVLKQNNGKPTYESINSMKYLDAVVTETMRLYPLASFLDRVCTEDFEMPPATPDGKPVTIKPGESVWFQSYSLHRDPKYYSEPLKFNPDRFLNESVDNSIYMPFGIGPRICIGNRFALMEAKIMMFYLLWRCDLEPDVKTKLPMVLDKSAFITTAEGGFWLKLRARNPTISIISCSSNGHNSHTKDT
ncbi:Cytochrome P450 9e2 [Ooceraea biroi]|uniref:Cytochrome P450 9e2 n=1 Tax=Ooceraea biroi TaxID=2015173 RepID=A0A026VV18_OOCBI|nr:Cytochrome P450 9e2 [Ooceraea biroi]